MNNMKRKSVSTIIIGKKGEKKKKTKVSKLCYFREKTRDPEISLGV